jgi:hypothetical protein
MLSPLLYQSNQIYNHFTSIKFSISTTLDYCDQSNIVYMFLVYYIFYLHNKVFKGIPAATCDVSSRKIKTPLFSSNKIIFICFLHYAIYHYNSYNIRQYIRMIASINKVFPSLSTTSSVSQYK